MLNNAVRLDGQTFACAAVSRKQIFTDMGSQTLISFSVTLLEINLRSAAPDLIMILLLVLLAPPKVVRVHKHSCLNLIHCPTMGIQAE